MVCFTINQFTLNLKLMVLPIVGFIMLLQVKEDVIRIKSVSILKDESKMMNENFPVAKKKKKAVTE